jgi:hypothetical protein
MKTQVPYFRILSKPYLKKRLNLFIKSVCLIFILQILTVKLSNGQEILLQQGFNSSSCPSGWTAGTNVSFVTPATSGTFSASAFVCEGTNFAMLKSYNITGGPYYLTSPYINTTGKSNISVTFDFFRYYDVWDDGYDAQLYIQYYNGSSWVAVSNTTESYSSYYQEFSTGDNGWCVRTIVLPSGANNISNLAIRFKFTPDINGYDIYIDNVKVNAGISAEGTYGNNCWVGSVYDTKSLSSYVGFNTELEKFDRNWGSSGSANTPANYSNMSIKYKMTKSFSPGAYIFTFGSDDGSRLSIDGGASWLLDLWSDHGYTATNTSAVCLSGSTNLVLDYYENSGDARCSFDYTLVAAPPTSVAATTSTPNICLGNTAQFEYSSCSGGTIVSGSWEYEWRNGSGAVVRPWSTTPTYSPTLTSTATYYLYMRNSLCTSYISPASNGVTVTVDVTVPTYNGYSNLSGYQYDDGTSYWVKGGNTLSIDIQHSDNLKVATQYLSFCKDGCTPNGCGGAPNEIKSYNSNGAFTDWASFIDDNYLNITGTTIMAGAWGSSTITNRWTTTVAATCPDWDWNPYTFLYDWCSNGVGYTALGKMIKVDNTAPTHDGVTVNDNCWVTNGTNTYTITIKSTEDRSGFGGSYGMMALINFNLGEPNAGGYFAWHPTSYVHSGNQMACTGGGYVSKYSGWGGSRIDLVSATTSISGNQRTVTFTVRPHSDFIELNGTNKISMYTSDYCNNFRGWTDFSVNFTSIRVPSAPTGTATICNGESTNINMGNTAPSGVTYYWQTSSNGTSTTDGSGSTNNVSPTSTTTYYIRPYSNSGCWGQASTGVTVTVNPVPLTTASVPSTTYCSVTPFALTGGPGSMSSYSWTGPSGCSYSPSSTVQNPTITMSSTGGTFTLTATDGNGCHASATTQSVSPIILTDPTINTITNP